MADGAAHQKFAFSLKAVTIQFAVASSSMAAGSSDTIVGAMGSLADGDSDADLKIILLGDSAVGKSKLYAWRSCLLFQRHTVSKPDASHSSANSVFPSTLIYESCKFKFISLHPESSDS